MSAIAVSLTSRHRLLAWGAALCVALIVLSELLALDYAFAWTAGAYLDSVFAADGVMIAGAALSLLIALRVLIMALRAERAIAADPDAVEIAT